MINLRRHLTRIAMLTAAAAFVVTQSAPTIKWH
jgi:hypothetical protein